MDHGFLFCAFRHPSGVKHLALWTTGRWKPRVFAMWSKPLFKVEIIGCGQLCLGDVVACRSLIVACCLLRSCCCCCCCCCCCRCCCWFSRILGFWCAPLSILFWRHLSSRKEGIFICWLQLACTHQPYTNDPQKFHRWDVMLGFKVGKSVQIDVIVKYSIHLGFVVRY